MDRALVSSKINKKETITKIQGKRKAGWLPIRWLDDVECDLGIMGILGWRRKAEDRNGSLYDSWGRSGSVIGCSTKEDGDDVYYTNSVVNSHPEKKVS